MTYLFFFVLRQEVLEQLAVLLQSARSSRGKNDAVCQSLQHLSPVKPFHSVVVFERAPKAVAIGGVPVKRQILDTKIGDVFFFKQGIDAIHALVDLFIKFPQAF